MPGFDRTGPAGRGSGTGRGFGPCMNARPGLVNFRGAGYGRGVGRGSGIGPCRFWAAGPRFFNNPASVSPEDEKTFLREQSELMKAELAGMEQRINDLEQG